MGADPLLPVALIVAFTVVVGAVLLARRQRGASRTTLARSAAMAAFAILIAADPTVAGGSSEAQQSAADVLFVIDTTASMAAEDYNGDAPRLDGVRADILELASAFPGAHFSLVRFDSQPRIEVPWTTDVGAVETALAVLQQERAAVSRGSQLDVALETINRQVPRPSSGDSSSSGFSVVFYFSDGEQRSTPTAAGDEATLTELTADVVTGQLTGGDSIESFEQLASQVDGGAVLGYGTERGAPMQESIGRDGRADVADDGYVVDYGTGARAVSHFDEAPLVEIADDIGVPFLHRVEPGGLDSLAASIADDAESVGAGQRTTRVRLYWVPAIGLLAVVLWQAAVSADEFVTTRRVLAPRRPPPAAAQSPGAVRPARPRPASTEPAA